jgi:hypothetical protein
LHLHGLSFFVAFGELFCTFLRCHSHFLCMDPARSSS